MSNIKGAKRAEYEPTKEDLLVVKQNIENKINLLRRELKTVKQKIAWIELYGEKED